MKKSVVLICVVCLCLAVCCATAFGEDDESPVPELRFADAEEASRMLLANRDYYDNLNWNDISFRMQKTDATREEMEDFAGRQTLDFTEEEKAAIEDAMNEIWKICEERGYQLPDASGIVFAKTTMKEECDAGAYTHGTEIFLGESFLDDAMSEESLVFSGKSWHMSCSTA